MYFMVEYPNDQNRKLLPLAGVPKEYQEWLNLGLWPLKGADPSIVKTDGPQSDISKAMLGEEYGPFVFGVVKHKLGEGRYQEITAYKRRIKQEAFEQETGAARIPEVKLSQGEQHPGIKATVNEGTYVFHLTTLRNLGASPDSRNPGTGIQAVGLDPNKGGGRRGACETSTVTGDSEMTQGPIEHSKGVVAVNTALSNLKMYPNHRHEHNLAEFAKGNYGEKDLIEREPIVLRFKLTAAHINNMEIDPKHPKDRYVRLIRGVPIQPTEIEALTSEGWKPLQALKELSQFMPAL
jgi:hypothetical protein